MQSRCHLLRPLVLGSLVVAGLTPACVWRTSGEVPTSEEQPADGDATATVTEDGGEPDLPEGVTRTITKNPDGTEHVDINVDLTKYDPGEQPQPDLLPHPFTAEQLKQGLAEGTTLSFRMKTADAGQGTVTWRITKTTEQRVTIDYTLEEGGEIPAPPPSETYPWVQLVDHASYPSAFSTRARESVTTSVGTFDAWVYEVRPPEADPPVVERLWFVDELPGPPVKHEVRSEGQLVHQMDLVADSRVSGAR